MEIERKFVPVMVPEEKELAAFPSVKMTQGYLCTDPVVRVRQENDSFVLTYKGAGLLILKKKGQRVEKGEVLFSLYADNEAKLLRAKDMAERYSPITIEGMLIKRISTPEPR